MNTLSTTPRPPRPKLTTKTRPRSAAAPQPATSPPAISPPAPPAPQNAPSLASPQPVAPAADRLHRDLASLFSLNTKPGYYNAAAKAALLRREKKPPYDEAFVDFAGSEALLQLTARDRLLLSGAWRPLAVVGGHTLTATGPWTEACWHREDLCDYLEIELPLSGGWRIERHLLLARRDSFLVLADALLGPDQPAVEIAYAQHLPLAAGIAPVPAKETREIGLEHRGRRYANILPLGIGEWRAEHAHADLSTADNAVHLRHAAVGRRMFAPLWIDLAPRRLKRPITWRRLSVGENLGIVPADIAAGYRVQAGDEQWLLYRSLTPFGNRSILGHNTAYSFICGKLKKDGNFDPIIEIE